MKLELRMDIGAYSGSPINPRKGYTTSGVIKTEIDPSISVEYRLASREFLCDNSNKPSEIGGIVNGEVYVKSGLHPAVQPFIALYHTFAHSDPGELADKFGSESIRYASVGHRQNIIVATTLQYAAQILRISEFKELVTQFKADGTYQDHIHGKIVADITKDKSSTAIVLHEERATGFYSGVMEKKVVGHHKNKWVRSSKARESIESATGTFDPFVTRADRVYREIHNDEILSTDLDAVAEAVERMKAFVGGISFTADYNLSRLLYLCSERAPGIIEFEDGKAVGENEVTLTRQAGKFLESLSLRLTHRQVVEKRTLEKALPLLESPQVDKVKYLPKLESALELAQRHIEEGTIMLGWMDSTLSALKSGAELPQPIGYQSEESNTQTTLTDSVRERIEELTGILTRRPDRLDNILKAVKARGVLEDLGCNTEEVTSKIHAMSRGENDQRRGSLAQPHLLEDER